VTPAVDLADRVASALRLVIDPELGENIVDLGLIPTVVTDDS
jgi:metal-sulfur cluster biosynthetic enzyme